METINTENNLQNAVGSSPHISSKPEVKTEKSLLQMLKNTPRLLIKKPLYGVAALLVAVLLLVLLVVVFKPKPVSVTQKRIPQPTVPSATESALVVSKTGQTLEFTQLEQQLKESKDRLENVSFSESRLQMPFLELQPLPKKL